MHMTALSSKIFSWMGKTNIYKCSSNPLDPPFPQCIKATAQYT